jgi:sec-independent protein translocase protein TatA
MGIPSGMELIVIALVILLLFGGKKIPELAKGLGGGIKNFKKALKEDDEVEVKKESIEAKEEKAEIKAEESQKA